MDRQRICSPGALKKRAPTLKQAAREPQTTLKTATALLEQLRDPGNYNWLLPDFRQMLFEKSPAHAELLTPLKEFIAELDHRLEVLACLSVASDPSNTNACKVHNGFWRELTYLWGWFDPNAGKLKRRHLQRYLVCLFETLFPRRNRHTDRSLCRPLLQPLKTGRA